MTDSLLKKLDEWYAAYAEQYRTDDPQFADAVRMKIDHTMRVCREVESLCESLGMDDDDTMLAGSIALLHDVSRFEQFRIFRTFADLKSVNHADLSCMIIRKNGLLSELTDEDTELILTAIRHHNAISLPDTLDGRHARFCRLLRDADKLDIYRIVIDQYLAPDPRRTETVEIGIPEGTDVSPEVCARILANKTVPYDMITSLNDFKLIQLGWVFDLNFPHSFRCVRERGYITAITSVLPQIPEVTQVVDKVNSYLDAHASNSVDSFR